MVTFIAKVIFLTNTELFIYRNGDFCKIGDFANNQALKTLENLQSGRCPNGPLSHGTDRHLPYDVSMKVEVPKRISSTMRKQM